MDARPDELTVRIRGKRIAIDNRLELLRVRLQQQDPRARLRQQWPALAGALAAGGVLWYWRRARRRRGNRRARGHALVPSGSGRRSMWRRRPSGWDPWSQEVWR